MNRPDGILLFGGAFNPPHSSHLRAMQHAQAQLPVSQTLILPAGEHPLKPTAGLAPAADRLKLCRIAFRDQPEVTVSDLELSRPGPNYPIDTLAAVQEQFPGRRLFWLIGADNLQTLNQWHEYRQLLRAATLVTIPRRGHPTSRAELAELDLPGADIDTLLAHVLQVEADGVSSTAIRAAIRDGQRPPAVDPAVMDEILQRGLYYS